MFSWLWSWLPGERRIPGVVYSHEMKDLEAEAVTYRGALRNVRQDNIPDALVRSNAVEDRPGPEEVPYTFWERVGLVPIHPSRVRPRQYYHPITDFGLYDYDELSPEEKELTARWMAKVMEFNGSVPLGILCAAGCLVLPLHTVYRMPLLVAAAITGVGVEVTRSYLGASKQRQDLDDFILAKEIWYIKNVETYQLGIPRIPRGREKEYQVYIDANSSEVQQLPEALIEDLHI